MEVNQEKQSDTRLKVEFVLQRRLVSLVCYLCQSVIRPLSFLSLFLFTQLLQNIQSPLKQTWKRAQIGRNAHSQLLSVTQLSLFLQQPSRLFKNTFIHFIVFVEFYVTDLSYWPLLSFLITVSKVISIFIGCSFTAQETVQVVLFEY